MSAPKSIESYLRTLEQLLEEATRVQAKARRNEIARLAERAVNDIYSALDVGNVPGHLKTHSKGIEGIGYLKACLAANGDAKATKRHQSFALRSFNSYAVYLHETGAISEPFKFRFPQAH